MKFHDYNLAKPISGSKNLIHVCILQLHSEILRKSCTTENDKFSSSKFCCKENLQLKVSALTQQPKKKWLNLALYQNKFVKILKRADH